MNTKRSNIKLPVCDCLFCSNGRGGTRTLFYNTQVSFKSRQTSPSQLPNHKPEVARPKQRVMHSSQNLMQPIHFYKHNNVNHKFTSKIAYWIVISTHDNFSVLICTEKNMAFTFLMNTFNSQTQILSISLQCCSVICSCICIFTFFV